MEYKALTFGLPASLCRTLKFELNVEDEGLTIASDLWDLVRLCSEQLFHLIVFRCQTLNICDDIVAALRRRNLAPVAILEDHFDTAGACAVLSAGADLCLPTEWPLELLTGHIAAAFRRYIKRDEAQEPGNAPFTRGGIYIDPGHRVVKVKGREVELRPREFSLLLYFMRNPGKALTADQICKHAWGMEYTQVVGKSVYELRKRIESNPNEPRYIQTVYRVSYRFTPNISETCEH